MVLVVYVVMFINIACTILDLVSEPLLFFSEYVSLIFVGYCAQENMAGDDVKKSDANASGGVKRKEVKKETGLGLTNCKDDNFGEWYSEVCLNVSIVHYSFG
ncbi:hypothetical protein F2P56_018344 [Juglans regia]|uniref:Uncharacterized protein n=1 Tax=Juglans regia TaxID=51240 RepID=A0A833XAT8_JUGRE|nr:hypothetical protein F2P56_018344 [Juglans regia]